jgi:stress-induced morphogen
MICMFTKKLLFVLGVVAASHEDICADQRGYIGGCGQMYEAIIVSPNFAKKTTLARHRLVNSTLKEEIAAIHAWTPKCHTPEEWEKKRPQ